MLHVPNLNFQFPTYPKMGNASMVIFPQRPLSVTFSSSTSLHLVTFPKLAVILSLIASIIYLLGIDFIQSFITYSSTKEKDDPLFHNHHDVINIHHQHQIPKLPAPPPPQDLFISSISSQERNEIVKSVVEGKTSSYSLESSLGYCCRAASIRREALQRVAGRSLQSLPLEGEQWCQWR
ncbi:hypothetical protein RIF29_20556 [Crotalaria pallida]|uniref:Uncharacterized protein n=1 Tax=Crotalaria pallida TaxID=3830 RepID=A0AAN9F2S4_CROPI